MRPWTLTRECVRDDNSVHNTRDIDTYQTTDDENESAVATTKFGPPDHATVTAAN